MIISSPLAEVRKRPGQDDRLRFHQAGGFAGLDELDFLSLEIFPKVLDRDFFGQANELPGLLDASQHRGRFWRGSHLLILLMIGRGSFEV